MLHKNLIEQKSGFRTIENHEIDAISGGIDRLYVGAQRLGDINAFTQAHGDGAGGLGGGNPFASLGTFGAEDINLEAIMEYLDELEDTWIDEDGDGLHDITGDGRPILVTADRGSLDGFELGPVNPSTGIIHYMYPLGPNGTVVPGTAPVATPEGEQFACDTFAEAQEAIADTEAQFGFLNNVIGFSPLSWLTYGVLTPQSQQSPPDHCR